ncbi:NADH dehydrogenase [ubiquinone] 1 alpha subcomplex assembly factor 4 [Pristis pectinata]|uniref:NADH dehydrogenase [ubiquinone] 1 alpha subcomplex assembly factor 4 n=1 Tax=Pristis pectinata TaxID=685728 RepID=UPI00223D0A10|nr:NADH dehydrogenase [ubiquinone] 1 alpha subcomplex assembly factor 4 [Pristis pectinata]
MGSRVTRALRNFNLENRAHAEISRRKPGSAPRHPGTGALLEQQLRDHPQVSEVHNKNEELLSFLKDVYVDSKDFQSKNLPIDETSKQLQEHRLPKATLSHDPFGITQIPKGKLSIVEALTVLNNHKLHPEIWTADKIAEEYSLELKDVKGLLEFFKPFEIKILPPKQEKKLISAR